MPGQDVKTNIVNTNVYNKLCQSNPRRPQFDEWSFQAVPRPPAFGTLTANNVVTYIVDNVIKCVGNIGLGGFSGGLLPWLRRRGSAIGAARGHGCLAQSKS